MAFSAPFLPAQTSSRHGQWTGSGLTKRRRAPARTSTKDAVRTRMPIVAAENGVPFATDLDGSKFRIGVVSTRWNLDYVKALETDVESTLRELKVEKDNIVKMQVPGSFELPMGARLMSSAQKVDAMICLGVLVKGETEHYEHIASVVSSGLMDLQLTVSIPVVFGVLTCTTKEQATARSTGELSHAKGWAKTAVEMAILRSTQLGGVSAAKKSVGFF